MVNNISLVILVIFLVSLVYVAKTIANIFRIKTGTVDDADQE